jgi:hypothetical protein
MNTRCCPFCHLILVLKAWDAAVARFQCPACSYAVLVQLTPAPVMTQGVTAWPR